MIRVLGGGTYFCISSIHPSGGASGLISCVQVSFSGSDKAFELQQLSGGQKTVVALSLIFAIQRCVANFRLLHGHDLSCQTLQTFSEN
jgi:hypothetical protein